jgi:glycosyltransferase involved in cell wall biosynthesis
MKVLHLNTSNKGGAGIAALRLHEQLLGRGVDSKFLSLYSFPSDFPEQYPFRKRDYALFPFASDLSDFSFKVMKKLKLRQPLTQAYEAKYLTGRPPGFDLFSFPYSEYRIEEHPLVKAADVVHLHWVCDSFLDYERFFSRIGKKVVWTLHDMFPFTGGCHHSDGCMKFTANCDVCPQLKGTRDESYSAKIMAVKAAGLKRIGDAQMKIVTPSDWLRKHSEKSNLFHRFAHVTVPNVMNEKIFTPRNKAEARARLSVPQEKKVILIVAHNLSNLRKGGGLLLQALDHFSNRNDLLLCSVGGGSDATAYPLPHMPFGYVNDEARMADIYAAADVFVLPSLAENFPNTICESLMCGTPVAAFNVGGIPELVNANNGQLATPFDAAELAAAIGHILERPHHYSAATISSNAHQQLNADLATNRYLAVYSDLLNAHA